MSWICTPRPLGGADAASGRALRRAKARALEVLRRWGIEERITIRNRELTEAHWWAQYRSRSQFRGGPVFWVNVAAHEGDEAALVDSILHEYGHVIWEWAEVRDRELFETIVNIAGDEEDFAETTAMVLQRPQLSSAYAGVISRFAESFK